jgi:hypothetical protein
LFPFQFPLHCYSAWQFLPGPTNRDTYLPTQQKQLIAQLQDASFQARVASQGSKNHPPFAGKTQEIESLIQRIQTGWQVSPMEIDQGELGDLVCAQLAQIAKDEHRLRRGIPWLFYRNGKAIPYGTIYDAWPPPQRRLAIRVSSCTIFADLPRHVWMLAPGISRSVAMTLLGHKTDVMFRRYIQRHDERLIEAAKTLAADRATKRPNAKFEPKPVTNR